MSRDDLGNALMLRTWVLERRHAGGFERHTSKRGTQRRGFTQLLALDRGNPTYCLSVYNDGGDYNLAEIAARCLAMVARVTGLRCVLLGGLSQPLYIRLGLELPS